MFFQNVTLSGATYATLSLSYYHSVSESFVLNPSAFSLCSLRICVESLRINLGVLAVQLHLRSIFIKLNRSAFLCFPLRLCGKNAFALHFQRLLPMQPLQRHKPTTRQTRPSHSRLLCRFGNTSRPSRAAPTCV